MGERKNSEQVKCRFLKYSETNFSLEVEGRDTLELLKLRIWEKTRIVPSKQKILYNCKYLENDKTKLGNLLVPYATIFLN